MIKFVHVAPISRGPRKTHVFHVSLLFRRECISSVLAQEGTHDIPNLEITPKREVPEGRSRPKDILSRVVAFGVLNKEQGQMPLLAMCDHDFGLTLLGAFRVKIDSSCLIAIWHSMYLC